MTSPNDSSKAQSTPAVEDFKYDTLDRNFRASKHKKQDGAEQNTSVGGKRKKRRAQESPTARAIRQLFDMPVLPTFTRMHIIYIVISIVALMAYVGNVFKVQEQQVSISRLKDSLEKIQLDRLHTSSELMRRTRKSEIHKILNAESDSTFESSPTPPYVIE